MSGFFLFPHSTWGTSLPRPLFGSEASKVKIPDNRLTDGPWNQAEGQKTIKWNTGIKDINYVKYCSKLDRSNGMQLERNKEQFFSFIKNGQVEVADVTIIRISKRERERNRRSSQKDKYVVNPLNSLSAQLSSVSTPPSPAFWLTSPTLLAPLHVKMAVSPSLIFLLVVLGWSKVCWHVWRMCVRVHNGEIYVSLCSHASYKINRYVPAYVKVRKTWMMDDWLMSSGLRGRNRSIKGLDFKIRVVCPTPDNQRHHRISTNHSSTWTALR